MKLALVTCHLQKLKWINDTIVLSNATELIEESTGATLSGSGLYNDSLPMTLKAQVTLKNEQKPERWLRVEEH